MILGRSASDDSCNTPGTRVWLKSKPVGESVKIGRVPARVREQGHTAKTYVIEYEGENGQLKVETVTGERLEYRDTEPRILLPEAF